MATKRTKPESPVAQAATPEPKRKVAVRAPAAEGRNGKPVAIPTVKPMSPPAPKGALKAVRKPPRKSALRGAENPLPPAPRDLSSEMVALRAYFIGERRQANGEPGDSTTDWLEAERQLRSETEG